MNTQRAVTVAELPEEADRLNARSREIGRGGGHLIVGSRASGGQPRWLVAVRRAAIASGCFVASATRRFDRTRDVAGTGWIISPQGDVLAVTSAEAPFATASIDLGAAEAAKAVYPRSVAT